MTIIKEVSSETNQIVIKNLSKISKFLRVNCSKKIYKFFTYGTSNFSIYYLRKKISNNSFHKFHPNQHLKFFTKILFFSFYNSFLFKKNLNTNNSIVFYFTGEKFYHSKRKIILEISKNNKVIILTKAKIKAKIKSKNIIFINIYHFLNFFIFLKIFYNFVSFERKIITTNSDAEINLFFLWLKEKAPNILMYEFLAKKFIKSIKPSAVFISDPQELFAQVITDLCNKNNIKNAFLQFGLTSMESIEWIGQRSKNYFVFDNFSKNVVEKFSIYNNLKKKYVLYGHPKFENLEIKYKAIDIKKPIFFSPVPKIDGFQNVETNIDLSHHQRIIKDLNALGMQLKVSIKVKKHPEDNFDYHKFVKKFNLKNIDLIENSSLMSEDLIEENNIIISTHSAAAFEAILLNKLTFILNIDSVLTNFYTYNNLGIQIKDIFEIGSLVSKNNLTKTQQQFLNSRQRYLEESFPKTNKVDILSNFFKLN